jgi:hypothetical protein
MGDAATHLLGALSLFDILVCNRRSETHLKHIVVTAVTIPYNGRECHKVKYYSYARWVGKAFWLFRYCTDAPRRFC